MFGFFADTAYLYRRRLILCTLLLVNLCSINVAFSSEPQLDQKPYAYKAKAGDSLNRIIQRLLIPSATLKDILEINPEIISDELNVGQNVFIPRYLLKYQQSTAVISYSQCASEIRLLSSSISLKLGSSLKEGDVITIPAECSVSLQFEDKSVVRMPSGGVIKVSVLRKNQLERSPEIQLDLLDGRVEVKVPKRQQGDSSFRVVTPNSVAGVRGTEFRVGFDSKNGNGQVEVSSGLVGTRGINETNEAGVGAQKGVVIPKTGLAGKVEDLPLPPTYLTNHPQQLPSWNLFTFQGDKNAKYYYLKSASSVNRIIGEVADKLEQPNYLSTNLSPTAIILEWSSQTESGLMGDKSIYGICADRGLTEVLRCNVNFDVDQLDSAVLTLQQLNSVDNSLEIIGNYHAVQGVGQLMVRGLPVGKYRWKIDYKIEHKISANQSGEFELIAVSQRNQ